MRVAMIGCPFRTSYGSYIESLLGALERVAGAQVQWIGSNCGCGDPVERRREFQTRKCTYFEMRQIEAFRSANRWKRMLRLSLRNALYFFRARRYRELTRDTDVTHLQQTLNAFGSDVVFHWLRARCGSARVVTIHELDAEQTDSPERNRIYNRADAIIVHDDALKEKLVALGVDPGIVHILRHGTDIPSLNPASWREGLVFYGGHKLMNGKGLDTVLEAMALLQERLGDATPRLRIHGHYGTATPSAASNLARERGVSERVDWLNQISMEEMHKLYRSSLVCLLPYTGSFAGLPAGVAAASELPVVGTRNAGIPNHLGDCYVWVAENSPGEIAERVFELLQLDDRRQTLGKRIRTRAEEFLDWQVVARKTHDVYRAAIVRRSARNP
jgi:glycosyltransferase involved in cell wall biosynthesis